MHIDEMFEAIKKNANEEFDFSFLSNDDLDNVEAMTQFLEESGLEDNVAEDDGTMVFLSHESYGFRIVVESFGLGDFYHHGITASKEGR